MEDKPIDYVNAPSPVSLLMATIGYDAHKSSGTLFIGLDTLDASLRNLGLRVLKTPYRSPQANAFCERLIGSARRECLDFMIPLNEDHVRWILKQWTVHYNKARPHSSLGPGIPDRTVPTAELQISRHCIPNEYRIVVKPRLGGLHHEYGFERAVA